MACRYSHDDVQSWRQSTARNAQYICNNNEVARGLFNQALKIAAASFNASKIREAGLDGKEKLGPLFEAAVAGRVEQWIASQNNGFPVCEVWRNVNLAQCSKPDKSVQELDIAFVLANGILIALECKSFEAEQKDLDARLLNLQRTGSQLAQFVLCGPLYTEFASTGWFLKSHEQSLKIRQNKFSFIPFTMAGQPGSYVVSEEKFDCQAFEAKLDGVFAPFIARA
jgi:hypothetical protein